MIFEEAKDDIPEVEVPEEKTEEEAKEAEKVESPEEEKPEASEEKKKGKSFDDRLAEIKKATWEKHEAQRRLEAREAELRKKEEELQQKEMSALKEPDPDDFEEIEKYKQAAKTYNEKLAELKAQQIAQKKYQEYETAQKQVQSQAKWNFKKEEAIRKNPEFANQERTVELALRTFNSHPVIEQMLIESDMSTDLVSYLGQHSEDLEKLASSHPGEGIKMIGRLEGKLSTKPEKPSQTPPPPVGDNVGGGSAPKNPENESFEDYCARRNKERYG